MATLISSQRYLDGDTVAAKIAAADYCVAVSPEFVHGGETYQVVIDGHHSLAAAREAGVEPRISELSTREHDAIALLERGDVETFLAAMRLDSDYYDVATGRDVW